jgi:DnaJ-class molecular chaperone
MQMGNSTDGTAPGDEAPPGTPGTGENLCRACNGSGTQDGQTCPVCEGSGKIIEGIGGG